MQPKKEKNIQIKIEDVEFSINIYYGKQRNNYIARIYRIKHEKFAPDQIIYVDWRIREEEFETITAAFKVILEYLYSELYLPNIEEREK